LLAVGSISGDGTAKQRHEERSPGRWDGSPSDVANFGTWELGNLGTWELPPWCGQEQTVNTVLLDEAPQATSDRTARGSK
jgi:hypothetical protein